VLKRCFIEGWWEVVKFDNPLRGYKGVNRNVLILAEVTEYIPSEIDENSLISEF
jgi:hypothetical protein